MQRHSRRRLLKYLPGVRVEYGGSAAKLLDSYLHQDAGAKHAVNLPVSQRYFYMKNRNNDVSSRSASGASQQHQMIQLRLGAAQMLSSSQHTSIDNVNEAHPLYYAQTSPRAAGLTAPLVLALKRLRIHRLTELQGALVPLLLKGKHVIAHSETGTGKSFGVALGIANRIIRDQLNYRLHTVVLVPTEELALQYDKWLRHFGGCTSQVVQVAIDSIPLEAQLAKLHNIQPHVLVGTPQRVADIVRLSPSILGEKLRRKVDCVVLDEADMIIHANVAYGRQRLSGANLVDRLFRNRREEVPAQLVAASATVDGVTAQTLNTWTRNDRTVRLTTSFVEHTIPPTIQFYFFGASRVYPLERCLLLSLQLICTQRPDTRILIFTEDERVAEVCALLTSAEVEGEMRRIAPGTLSPTKVFAGALHALPRSIPSADTKESHYPDNPVSHRRVPLTTATQQAAPFSAIRGSSSVYEDVRAHQVIRQHGDVYVKNNSSLSRLNEGKLVVGVGSFNSSRGLHVNGITHVILYGACPSAACFVHCAGRTGRMGAEGDVLVLYPPSSGRQVQQVCSSLEIPFHSSRMSAVEDLLRSGEARTTESVAGAVNESASGAAAGST
ncbi:ATP-dependent DEAD/H RNA helicase [Leishmania donovani]|uniref:DEAD-boc_ATP-dependent_(RNA)_helicase_-_putative n=3 Tax=Leishmania donovani species complex TaxID=38574 RepID=A0A6L0WKR3_LEIIN|nr:putative DEAD-boc ATP-dependent (RNA) helicase [Leishmania infantum JPCM5]XP_003858997.1 DEAD-boc ATP-dependent (RNA) helicase, putative [Leishmania donovani]CAC9459825.1 DEAD-boc_ATP-dependent_(RNA)_helicase_-_putative [Leishmania infantum]AYU76788.1 DEAD-boc ATP-dependent (RNA) helicase, putative [Leishmania donovani]TPP39806.1 DEAD/DEAH box helicase family protein [Leishmania donovani]TPP53070.1 DEAD/DEAH box helicase family protein [Leishmania donovani]CAJ1986844.1 ATP-dependent DEAD/H|eukprot:XP_001463822.1 putative DEAD-boc ATP-dependent (RNA) helicase [Leishmania infantum JPCM5]